MVWIVAIVLGALFGGLMGNDGGAVFGALIGWLLVRTQRQQRELKALREAIGAGSAAPAAAAAGAVPAQPDAVPASAPELGTPPLAPEPLAPATPEAQAAFAQTPPAIEPTAVPAIETTTPEPASEPHAPGAAIPPAAPARDWLAPLRAWFFGGNTIVKAGVGILFLGLAFLAKYATEHVHVPIELRLAGIAAVAIVLLVLGWRLRGRRPGYAQALQGGAVAVLYLTVFVAFKFYGVLAVVPVFALMVLIAALAAALAVLQEARGLAVIGVLGGFATPLLVSTGSGNQVALFSYYLVLNLGIVVVAWFRTWRVLNVIGFLWTFVVGTAWGVMRYSPDDYASSQGFLITFFLIFVAVLLLPARRGTAAEGRGAKWVNGSLLFGLPTAAFALQYGLVKDTAYGVALSALVLAAFYVLLAMWMRRRPALALTFEASLAIGTVFLTLVIPFALDARSTAGAWSLEGGALVWLGLRQQRRLPRALGYALLVLAGFSMMWGHQQHGLPDSPWNAVLFNALMAAAASLAAAYFVHQHRGGTASPERIAEPLLIAWATLWLLSAALLQIERFLPWRLSLAAWIGVLSAIALVYTLLAARLAWRGIGLPVLAHAPLLMLCAPISAVLQTNPLHHGGWWAWGAALAVHALALQRAAPHWPEGGRRFVHAAGAWVVAGLLAMLGRALTHEMGDAGSAWPWLGWLVGPALVLALLLRPRAAALWPMRLEPAAYQGLAAGGLSLALLAWVLLANVVSNGAARPLPHLPLLNPLDLGLAAALLAIATWLRRVPAGGESEELAQSRSQLLMALVGGVGFLWLNGMLVRAFHHWGGVPYHLEAWSASLAVQTGLTLLWSITALALMWWAARQGSRTPWVAGAVLLGVVVLKLLLVDLSGTGTVTRIVSFIGVGVLMLVIGYVAPLPATAEKKHAV
jgi:uncharacterized membrane protein